MSIKKKVAIFLAAVLITFIGFSLIASPAAIDVIRAGRQEAVHVFVNVVVTADAASHFHPLIKG